MSATAVVWGNCQADPLADLLTAPLAAAGIQMLRVPPVFLATADELAEVHDAVRGCRLLISQPVSEEYPLPGSGTAHLASLLPPEGRLVTFPVAFHVGGFPYQVHGYDAADGRVDAPITDYHDLRVVWAAAHGLTVSETLQQWPTPPADGVRAVHEASLAEIERRERELDVTCSALLARPGAVWTMDHPSNTVLAATARAVLQVLDVPDDALVVREREYLGQRRTPVEPAVAAALGWPAEGTATEWIIDGRTLPNAELLDVQLGFYRQHPDVVARTLTRAADRMQKLGLPRYRRLYSRAVRSFVLVPGAGGSSWVWSRVARLLVEAGHEAIAVDLPGDDETKGLSDYAEIVIAAIDGRIDVVLVAGSLGGFTAPMVCERAPAGTVGALVLVNAMIPNPGETAGDWWDNTGAVEARDAAAERGGYGPFEVATYFLHDIDPALAAEGEPSQRPQAQAVFASVCDFSAWPWIPIRVLCGADDRFFPVELQRRVARERLDVEADVIPGGHLLPMAQPRLVADYLLT